MTPVTRRCFAAAAATLFALGAALPAAADQAAPLYLLGEQKTPPRVYRLPETDSEQLQEYLLGALCGVLLDAGRLQQREYQTKEGENRTIVEVIADEAGPSLRWAQAQVERISRDAATSGGAGGRSAPDPVYGDEEPF